MKIVAPEHIWSIGYVVKGFENTILCIAVVKPACTVKRDRPTVCPKSRYPFYLITYYTKWVTASWTGSSYSWREVYIYK